ncbi:hypothetical protein FE634_04640 [Nocardioides dongxiaopingii]|uniref:hypothetical protein n=1 Tax=Nocardioides sp. S-1144 TaxID=2582905 RepID=UPI00110D88F6|nr:hypothetical protein [Nocardioides sp. S-1144]QCW49882.1 hypothetical protein FE634_04640 [Nocardioides sp. S-1144]
MSSAVRVLLLALLATAVVVAVGLTATLGGDDDTPAPPAPSTPTTVPPTPLADYDTLTVAIPRAEFCGALPPEAVERALGAPATDEGSYGDGQPAVVVPGVRDVAHEFGCSWTSGAVTARAWVFAPAVTVAEGRRLVAAARGEDGCTPVRGAAAFGRPSVALTCERGRRTVTTFRGLFGDAWLSCSLEGRTPALSGTEALERAGEWCVAVAQGAASVVPDPED